MNTLELNFRQIHLDFHTSPDILEVGNDFNAEDFVQTLVKAKVNSITCFARCHHGMMYYDSKLFPELVHPNLKNRNLLKEQIEVCHKHGIRVPIYTTVMWDDYMAKNHPEWLAIDELGNPITWNKIYEPGFYRFLCVNSPYRNFLKEHVKEILDTFGDLVDGLFFDILIQTDCSCKYCQEKMKNKGYNPIHKDERIKFAADTLDDFMLDMSSYIRNFNKNCSIFYNSSHVGPAIRPRLEAHSHLELESLPSGPWGYLHFPVTMRYARNHGLDCLSHTGKFHTEWGDFHSFKNKEALEFECFHMLALNSKCLIGDQMEPNGKLSKPVYELIGSVYEQVEKKEEWCKGAKAVTDIGVFTPEEFTQMGHLELHPAILGATEMLVEAGHQFDIIDSKSDFSNYKVLILPDNIIVSKEFEEKINKYVYDGGSVLATFESGLNEDKTEFNLKGLGVKVKDKLTCDIYGNQVKGNVYERNDYADYIFPKGEIGKGLPETEHVMYIKGLEVDALPGSEVLAKVVLPFFNRTYEHFSSHRQASSSGITGYDGIVKNEKYIYFAHPIFTQYRENAPKWCKTLLINALNMLLPESILRHDGPSTMITAVNEQKKENRWVIHLLNYLPLRRCKNIDTIEDIIPLYNIKISIKLLENLKDIQLVPEKEELKYEVKDGRVEFVVPKVNGHQMISINYK